jgi:cardiolipin synthase
LGETEENRGWADNKAVGREEFGGVRDEEDPRGADALVIPTYIWNDDMSGASKPTEAGRFAGELDRSVNTCMSADSAPRDTPIFREATFTDQALARLSGASLQKGNRLSLLRNGSETYDDWLAAIARARRWVHLENYVFKANKVGRRFAEALADKAAEGVQVRVLYDWLGSKDAPASFWRKLRLAGVDVRAANPPALRAKLWGIARDHRKLLAVDGEYASTGGVCIDDKWLQRSSETGLPYRDTAISVRGPLVTDLERAFSKIWEYAGAPLPAFERPELSRMATAGDTSARAIATDPGSMQVTRTFELLAAGANQRLWIADAYLIPVPFVTGVLTAAARGSVDVRLLLPATNDVWWVGALSRVGYRRLLKECVRIFEYVGPMMHAKTAVVDGYWSLIGSTDLNLAELVTCWQLDLLVEDTHFGAEMEAMFEEDLAAAREILLGSTHR